MTGVTVAIVSNDYIMIGLGLHGKTILLRKLCNGEKREQRDKRQTDSLSHRRWMQSKQTK